MLSASFAKRIIGLSGEKDLPLYHAFINHLIIVRYFATVRLHAGQGGEEKYSRAFLREFSGKNPPVNFKYVRRALLMQPNSG